MGAVYLYSVDGVLLSTLTGSSAGDRVGLNGVVVLANGNFVVVSQQWSGGVGNAGAVTWVDGNVGLSGVVSAANSLVGSIANDTVGAVRALGNGNYVVLSPSWDNGATVNAGAVTWGDGDRGVVGVVSPANSLIGTTPGDRVGDRVTVLASGDYVVRSPSWTNGGGAASAGAATWVSGADAVVGTVSASNSLVGTSSNDNVGEMVVELANGNYVAASRRWDNGAAASAGAVTWCSGSGGCAGVVSPANSLVGSSAGDSVGFVTALANGHYVVHSGQWDGSRGAATWADGETGLVGAVSSTNSLVGSAGFDGVGGRVVALANGNYVVVSSNWSDGPISRVGAVTWSPGVTGRVGEVSPANSLVGSNAFDNIGDVGVSALDNGNYVVASRDWNHGTTPNVGAVTWGDGAGATVGPVSAGNSLIGSTSGDSVGEFGVIALRNGHYVVRSPSWHRGGKTEGAVTWADGDTGLVAVVSADNSLVGTRGGDLVGSGGVTALANGDYVVVSDRWDFGGIADAGATTWGSGATGIRGEVSALNSLVGTRKGDSVGNGVVVAFEDGNHAIHSAKWNEDGIEGAGAVTLARGDPGVSGFILPLNSVRGSVTLGGSDMPFDYDPVLARLVVGRPASNLVSLLTLPSTLLFASGFE